MVIPRENKLVRLYIQLNEVNNKDQQIDHSKITPEIILKSAQKIIYPFKLSYAYCDWWTAYQVDASLHSIGVDQNNSDFYWHQRFDDLTLGIL